MTNFTISPETRIAFSKKIINGFGSFFLTLFILTGMLTRTWATTYNVPADFATIQLAIDGAMAGDVITVDAGTYTEQINLNKAVTIQGANVGISAGAVPGIRGAETIIDGGFIVSAAATLDGLKIINGRSSGSVKVGVAVATNGVTILNCIIQDVGMVPLVAQSDGISTQPGNNNLTVTDSEISNNWRGVYLNPGSGHTFTGNLIDANNGVGVGIGSDGQSNLTLTGNIISNHTLEGWGSSAVGANVVAENNQFLNNGVSVAHYGGTAIDASPNYWGSANPDFGVVVSGNVIYDPWWTDAGMSVLGSNQPVHNVTQDTYHPTIAAAITAAVANDVIVLDPGTYNEQFTLNKDITIDGGDKTTTFLEGDISFPNIGGGRYFVYIPGGGAGATIKNITFKKLDKPGTQNIIGLQANNVTVEDCDFMGQYVIGDPDVSRAFEVSVGGISGILIQNCNITNLRQPGYFNPNSSGQVLNCYADETKGWVVVGPGSNIIFSGNTWGTNAADIALLSSVEFGPPYDPIADLSSNNDGAIIEDQRAYVAYNINKDIAYNTSIQDAINAADNGDAIQVRCGTRNEAVTVSKEVTIQGAGNGTSAASNTILQAGTACTGNGFTVSANNVTIKNIRIEDYNNGVQIGSVTAATLENLVIEDHCIYGVNLAGSSMSDITITRTTINRTLGPGTTVGIRAGTANAVDGMLIDDCTITNNRQGISVFQSGTPVAFDNITIQNSTISNNTWKGMYFEKLRDAMLSGLTMDNNGTDALYDNNASIDINLKFDDYKNITIQNCDITNSGVTGTAANPETPVAIGIKARDDGGSYGPNPATLDTVQLINNLITGPQNGIRFGEYGTTNATPTNVTLENNDLGYAFANKAIISRINADVDLNCNWHGTTDIPTITAGFTEAGSGAINLNQLLDVATDGDPGVGYQPSGTCICPSGLLVTNDNTHITYCTIQEAIDDATAGDKLIVSAGTYDENVIVNKAIILEGANANIACGSRDPESVLAPSSGTAFTVTADGVTINGFEITAPGSPYAIVCGNTSDLTIKFNNIHDLGTTVNGSNVHAINYTLGNDPISEVNVIISDNCFDNIGSFDNHQKSNHAIGILQSTTTGTLTNLNIERNVIKHVFAKKVDWSLGGRIAYGININVGGNANFLSNGKVVNAIIRDNEISDMEGFISTGIGLEGNTENAIVENNSVSSIKGHKYDPMRSGGGYDLSGLKFEANRYVGTCIVQENAFQTQTFEYDDTPGFGYAVSNYVTVANGGTATLSCNWFGTDDYDLIKDNASLTGKVFNKDNCSTNFLVFLVDGADDDSGTPGFQPVPFSCTGCPGGATVTNASTNISYCSIQDAIDDAADGDRLKVKTGTYDENVDATAKDIIFAPGNSPGCVTINGDYTLNSGDVLEMEIEGTTPCTEHDQIIVTGTVTLGGATLTLPPSIYLAEDGDMIVLIDGSSAIAGQFAQGNFVTDGQNTYYIDYEGGNDGFDVVLTKCCGALVDIGIFTTTIAPVDNPFPIQDVLAGHKLLIKARPTKDMVNAIYTQGTFTIRTLHSNGVTDFAGDNVHSDFGYVQVGSKQHIGMFDYFIFNFENGNPAPQNWLEGVEYDLLTLTYSCAIGDAEFELVTSPDDPDAPVSGMFYQEINGETVPGAQGIFYAPHVSVTGPEVLSILASSNSPVCQTMEIDLNSTTSNGSPSYTYEWDGPDSYMSTMGDPDPFTALLSSAGDYSVTVTDGNGCTATASTTVEVPATSACVKNEDTNKYYPTITQAIDAALTDDGHTLTVPVGTWAEDVIVDKELTINGPKYMVSGCDPGRGSGEAIVVPATAAISSGEIFHVAASNVTIAGFTIDGDNPLLNSGFINTTPADIDAAEGVTVYETGINNLTVTNNVFQNLSYYGVTLYDYPAGVPSSGHTISDNKFQDLGTYDATSGISFWGGGVLLYNNQYAKVLDNCMDNVRIGVQTGNFYQANPGLPGFTAEIDGNSINTRRRGIFHNLQYSNASSFTLTNNTITAIVDPSSHETVWDGILLSSLSVASTSQDNDIDGSAVSNPSEGYEVWNVKNTFPADISGGNVSGVDIGVFVNNYEGYLENAGNGAHATLAGATIAPNASGTGIRVLDSPLSTSHDNVQLSILAGNSVSGGTKGLVVENTAASMVGGTLNNLIFSGQTGNYIELINNSGNLDGTSVTFDGTTGAAKTLTQNFATEDQILHKTDDAALGFVRVKAAEVFVTPNSGLVQRGILAAATNDIVNVANGTYNEDVNINKTITVDGESLAAIIQGLYSGAVAHSVFITANDAILKDVKVTRDYGANLAAWYACTKNQGVTIANGKTGVMLDNVWITGNRNGFYANNAQSFTVQNCIIEDNRTGVQLVNNVSDGQIINSFIRNNFTLGVLYNVFNGTNFVGTNFKLNENDITGNWYAQVAFHDNGAGGTIGDLTGFDNNCNWYGTLVPNYAAIPAGEPGYGAQVPSQFGGTDPGLDRDIRGTKAFLITYIPFLTDGTDDMPGVDGFQPVAGSCNGLGVVVNQTQVLTYPTIQLAVDDANPGDIIYAPAGTYPENVNITTPLVLKGNNELMAGCGSRNAESIISGGGETAVTISANGVSVLGFQINGRTAVSSTGYTDAVIKNNKINAQVFGVTSAVVVTSGTDEYTVQDNCIDLISQAYEAFPFDVNPTNGPTQAPGTWYVDRFAPAGFVSENFDGDNRLKHSIDASDSQGDPFYNTQGRKYDIDGATAMSIELYVPAAWSSTNRRMAGFWGTAVNAGNSVTDYPILEFASDGGVPRFHAWDSGLGDWVDMGLPTGFAYNQWYTLNIELVGNDFVFNVGDLELTIPADPGTVHLTNVILQGYNHIPITYDIYWDNLNTFGSPAATANTPSAGVVLAAATGTDAVTLQDNSVNNAFYGYILTGVTTSPITKVTGGTYTDLLQGVAVLNTADGVNYAPSNVGVEDLTFDSFSGDYPAIIPDANFHSGIYGFTGGSNAADAVDIQVNNVTIKNTGKTDSNSAGFHLADFSTGAGNRLHADVTLSTIEDNLNRGIYVRGNNATASISTSNINENGADPYATGGNHGFGVIAGKGAEVTLLNNYISNPATQISDNVTALFEGFMDAATIIAHDNHIDENGNGELTSTASGSIDGTCNWWGTNAIDVIDADVDGNVTFIPYLDTGVDTDADPTNGFQPAAPCVNPKHWFVNDNALGGDVYTLAVGNDLNQGTIRRPFLTIGKAINTVVSSDTIYVDAGSYDEQSVVPETKDDLFFIGAGLSTIVDFTGTVSGKPTLFDIAGNNTTVDGFNFMVDLSKLSSAIIATDLMPGSVGSLDAITIINNTIEPYQSAGLFGPYSDRNAISINYGGSTNYRNAVGGVDGILVDNNTVIATVVPPIIGDGDDIAFRSAVSVDEGAGTYTRNTFQSINHDILIRFNGNGPVVIGGSPSDGNTFNGGGVQYSDPNAGGGMVTISDNSFDGEVTFSVLRLQNNYHDAVVNVEDNTFDNLRWGISLENFSNTTVANNSFIPLSGYTDFRHITVNTKSLSSNSSTIDQVPVNSVITGNTFNSLTPTTAGTAIAFYNHDSNDAMLGTFTIGGAGSLANTFAKDFTYAAYMGDQMGNTYPAPVAFPEYDLGATSNTIMACWDKDVDLTNNTFDVGSGPQLPLDMNHTERVALEDILYHKPDNSCLGKFFQTIEVMAKVFLQGPFDSSNSRMNDNLRTLAGFPLNEPHTQIDMDFEGSFPKTNNTVTETINASVLAVTDPDDAIVDWIWLELRDKNDLNTTLFTRSALVQRDGDIVDLDGTSEVAFPDAYQDQYYLMVRHRNHLAAMTAAVVPDLTSTVVDFTTAAQPTYGTTPTSARRLVKTGVYGLWAGNTYPITDSGDDFNLKYNGSSNDRAPILTRVGPSTPLNVVNGYYIEDVNMNGQVKYSGSGNDRVIILNNVGPSTPLNVIEQEPNN